MKRFISILSLLFGLMASVGAWAADTTSISYKENQRVQQMVNLLNQQVAQNASLPKGAGNYIVDGRFKENNTSTLDETTLQAIRQKLETINTQDEVAFYVLIPPPLLLDIKRGTDKDKAKLSPQSSSALYQESRNEIQKFTNSVFVKSAISKAQFKGILLNLDSFIDIDEKQQGDKNKIIEEAKNTKFRELFYPCIAFGSRIQVETIRKAINEIRFASEEIAEKPEKLYKTFFSRAKINKLAKVYVGTLSDFIQGEGEKFKKDDVLKPQFQANLSAQLTKLRFGEIGKIKVYDKSKTKVIEKGSVVVRDHAGVFNGEITSFLSSDPFLKQFLTQGHRFQLEVITTSDASIAASRQQPLSDIKGKTAHQIAYEREIAPNAVRISMHFRHEGEKEVVTHWTMRLGRDLLVSKNGKTIEVIPPAGSITSLADFLNVGLQLLEKALVQVLKGMDKLKVPDTMWNDSTLTEPAKTVLPLLAGVYNAAIEQLQEAPQALLDMIKFLKNIVNYVADAKYREEVNKVLSSLKISDLGDIIKSLIQEKIDKYKQYGKIHNPSYVVGNALVTLIIEAIRTGSGTKFLDVIKSSMKKLKDKRRGKGGGNKKGNGGKKDDKKKDDKKDDKNSGQQAEKKLAFEKVKGRDIYIAYEVTKPKQTGKKAKGKTNSKETKKEVGKLVWDSQEKQARFSKINSVKQVDKILDGLFAKIKTKDPESITLAKSFLSWANKKGYKYKFEKAYYLKNPVPVVALNGAKTKAFLKKDEQDVGTLFSFKKVKDQQIKLEISDPKKLQSLIKKYNLKYEDLLKEALKKAIPANTEQIILAKSSKEFTNWAKGNTFHYQFEPSKLSKISQLKGKGTVYTKKEVLLFAKQSAQSNEQHWDMAAGKDLKKSGSKTTYIGEARYDKTEATMGFSFEMPKSSNEIFDKIYQELKNGNTRQIKGLKVNSKFADRHDSKGGFLTWVKNKGFKYVYKIETGQYYLVNQSVFVRRKKQPPTVRNIIWEAFKGIDISKQKGSLNPTNLKPLAEASFKRDFGSEKHLLAFNFKGSEAPGASVANELLNAFYAHIIEVEKERVSSIFVSSTKNNLLRKEVQNGVKAVKDISSKKFKTLIAKWAIGKQDKQGQKIFQYAAITSDRQANGQGGGIKITREACFVGSTKVWLANDAPLAISKIKRGMKVRARQITTGQDAIGMVTHVTQRQVNGLVKVYTPVDTFLVTYEHPYRANDQWVEAGELKKGDVLTLMDHKRLLAIKNRFLPRAH
ncbi:MAG TPA: hypothetical protein DCS93_32950, partial [Microscillaceae bacterium]|nr:hypothetical protein [Microscillaceae bacterium]